MMIPPKIKRIFLVISLGLAIYLLNYVNFFRDRAVEIEYPTDQRLESLIKEARRLYESKYREIEWKASELFGVNFSEYKKDYRAQINQLNLKIWLIEIIQDPEEREHRTRLLEKKYENSSLLQYMHAKHYLQNEIAKDHIFVGKYLSMLEKIVGMVIKKDPLFRYILLSDEFQKKHGLILTRVVWETKVDRHVFGVTQPLNMDTIFANKANIPMLIRITPDAFLSIAFLRSILIHELNHVYMYRDPLFSDIKKFSGQAARPTERPFKRHLKSLNPFSHSYQYHLIHEYYSLKAELMFGKVVGEKVFYKLDEDNKKTIKKMLAWVYFQLNKKNKRFVDANPTPPIFKIIKEFYSVSFHDEAKE